MPDPRQVRWTAPAARDLQDIARYIRKDDPSAARAVAKKLFDTANGLNILPMAGRVGRIAGTRELVVPPLLYSIIYQVASSAVHILRINHGARNWLQNDDLACAKPKKASAQTDSRSLRLSLSRA